MPSIAICIPTLKRPDGLDVLLKSMSELTFTKQIPSSIKICVADNDPQKSAEQVVEKWKGLIGWKIAYDVENKPGIPFVRNKLVRMAEGVDFIAFIDDDEIASPQWLDELLNIQIKYNADVIMGPVIPNYKINPPDWIVRGKFHFSSRFKDGITESNLITWNLLIRQNLFKKYNVAFEKRMALTGGTDILIGRLLKQAGIKFYWSDRAVVKEIVPPERSQLSWLLLRRFRAGLVEVLVRKYSKETGCRIKNLVSAVRSITIGILKTLTFVWNGKYAVVKGICYMSYGIGIIWGTFGFTYEEYKRYHSL